MNFEPIRAIWILFNLFILVVVLTLPIWILVKINSIDRNLKKLLSKFDDE